MKIAQVAPLYEAVPPRFYGGTERVVAHLCDALVDLGHEVTLFSSADADTRAELVAVRDQAIRLDPAPLKSDLAAHLSMLCEVRRQMYRQGVQRFGRIVRPEQSPVSPDRTVVHQAVFEKYLLTRADLRAGEQR